MQDCANRCAAIITFRGDLQVNILHHLPETQKPRAGQNR